MEKQRAHRKLVVAILVFATLLGLVSVFSIWVKRQALETDTWTSTSTKLLEDKDVNEALSAYMVEALYENVDVQGELAGALPPAAKPLAGPAAAGLRQLAGDVASEALTRPRVQALWSEANRTAHGLFLELIEGGGDTLSTEGGNVALDLGAIVDRLGEQLGVDVADKLPPDAAQIQLVESEQLSTAQDVVKALKGLSVILPLITLALYALAVYLARGWRREAIRAWGISWMVIGVLVLVIRSVAGEALVGSLASSESVEPAVGAVWDIGTSLLRNGGIAMFAYGLVIFLGAVLAGPLGFAKRARRSLAPLLRERATAYAAAAIVVLLLLWWGPTEGFRRPLPLLVLLALFVAGIEALRRRTLREYPRETWDTMRDRWAARFSRHPSAATAPTGTGGTSAESSNRVGELERLVALRDAGALDAEEFAQEKQRLLG
ncbi:MAG TPA: SHOCT domain-containing protein [Solirubrobacterales bacterium]|nr:SHOCT domain-containing protein [Solirubrobacterales bacterium]